MRTVYNKLVRDRVPELVRKQGKRCKTDTLTDAQYLVALYRKMEEELAEYRANPCIEELADLYEVVRAVAVARGYSMQDLEDARAEKERQRGAFGKRVFLLHIEEYYKLSEIRFVHAGEGSAICYASLAEKTRTPPRNFFGGVFLSVETCQSLPCVKGGGLRSKTEGL